MVLSNKFLLGSTSKSLLLEYDKLDGSLPNKLKIFDSYFQSHQPFVNISLEKKVMNILVRHSLRCLVGFVPRSLYSAMYLATHKPSSAIGCVTHAPFPDKFFSNSLYFKGILIILSLMKPSLLP